jgi:hypothetical protein
MGTASGRCPVLRDKELLRLRPLLGDTARGAARNDEPGGEAPCEEREDAEPLRRREGSRAIHAEGEAAAGGVDCESALAGGGGVVLWRREPIDLAVRRELFERMDWVSVRYEFDRERFGVWPLPPALPEFGAGLRVRRGRGDGAGPERCRGGCSRLYRITALVSRSLNAETRRRPSASTARIALRMASAVDRLSSSKMSLLPPGITSYLEGLVLVAMVLVAKVDLDGDLGATSKLARNGEDGGVGLALARVGEATGEVRLLRAGGKPKSLVDPLRENDRDVLRRVPEDESVSDDNASSGFLENIRGIRLSLMGVGAGDADLDRPVARRRRPATPEILEREGVTEGATLWMGGSTTSTCFRRGAEYKLVAKQNI